MDAIKQFVGPIFSNASMPDSLTLLRAWEERRYQFYKSPRRRLSALRLWRTLPGIEEIPVPIQELVIRAYLAWMGLRSAKSQNHELRSYLAKKNAWKTYVTRLNRYGPRLRRGHGQRNGVRKPLALHKPEYAYVTVPRGTPKRLVHKFMPRVKGKFAATGDPKLFDKDGKCVVPNGPEAVMFQPETQTQQETNEPRLDRCQDR